MFFHESHKDFFFKILTVLDNNKIDYCLIAGTLLGAIRENAFLIDDHKDTDIALDDKYYWQMRRLLNKLVIEKQIKWSGVWRKELSVLSLDNKYKLDFIFLEEKNDNDYYIYSYKKNEEDHKWNHEWRQLLTKSAIFPTVSYLFYNREVKIPNNSNQILTEAYGDWETPDRNWHKTENGQSSSYKYKRFDSKYKGFYPAGIDWSGIKDRVLNNNKYDIGFVCTTLGRDMIKRCVRSIRTYQPNIKIYVADQNIPNGEMLEFYEENDVEYYFTPFDSGISYNRNFLVNKVQEPYILLGDDDLIFTKDSRIDIFKNILEDKTDIGIVGGVMKNHLPYNLRIVYDFPNKKIYKIKCLEKTSRTTSGNVYNMTDCVLNFFLARKEIFNEIQWDNTLKILEHLDFFIRFKYNTNWKVAFTSDVFVYHCTDEEGNSLGMEVARPEEYRKYRNRKKEFTELLCKKYKLTDEKDFVFINDNFTEKINNNILTDNTNKELPPVIIETKIEERPIVIPEITDASIVLNEFVEVLRNLQNEQVYLSKNTCLQAVKSHNLIGTVIYLTTTKLTDKEKEHLELKGYKYIEEEKRFVKNNYKIVLDYQIPNRFKLVSISGIDFKVPFPVVSYLQKLYGDDWKTKDDK